MSVAKRRERESQVEAEAAASSSTVYGASESTEPSSYLQASNYLHAREEPKPKY